MAAVDTVEKLQPDNNWIYKLKTGHTLNLLRRANRNALHKQS